MNEDIAIAKDPSRVAGGKARAAGMTPEERREAARHAAEIRWAKPSQAPHCEDGIRQHHGLAADPKPVRVWESNAWVHLDGSFEARTMTPAQARYLADQLYALSRRIDRRQGK